jgi:hypothetical protein
VSLAVQFEGASLDEFDMLAKYWPAIRDDFPHHDKQPPLPPIREEFARPPGQGLRFDLLTTPPVPRYWFMSADRTLLVQVQSDRYALNWRQTSDSDEYPRYRQLRPEFVRRFTTFLDFVPTAKPTWCELTYINHVPAAAAPAGPHGPLARILRVLNPTPVAPTLPPVEDTRLQQGSSSIGKGPRIPLDAFTSRPRLPSGRKTVHLFT